MVSTRVESDMNDITKRWLLIVVGTTAAGIFTIWMVLMLRGMVPVPQYLEIFGLQIRLYSLTALSGILTTIFLFDRFRKQDPKLKEIDVWEAGLVALIPGVLGARVYHVITEYHLYQGDIAAMLDIRNGGLGIIGGFIFGGIALATYLKWKKVDTTAAIGLLVVFIPIAQIIGRLGNFFNRELFGLPTDLPWAMYVSPDSNPIPILRAFEYFHPIFLYESIANFVLAAALFRLWRKRVHGSTLIILYLVGYGMIRYILDFFRVEGRSGVYFQDLGYPLSYAQILVLGVLLFIIVFGGVYQVWYKNKYGVWFTDKAEMDKLRKLTKKK